MLRKAIKNAREISSTAMDIFALRYPGFIYGGGFTNGQIPVFCFHGVEPLILEAMLTFLNVNRYVTLHADEYLSVLTGKTIPPKRAVMLTFDDGWGSLWSSGFPLIKKYNAKIVVFIPPGRIEHSAEYLPTIADAEYGRCSMNRVLSRDLSDQPLLSWEEIYEMHQSGLVDFQSHSYSHRLIYKSPQIVDFVHPGMLKPHNLLELPYACNGHQAMTKPPVRLGEPMYESDPRLSDTPGMLIDSNISDKCSNYVNDNGGPLFFDNPNWRTKLQETASGAAEESGSRWGTESPEEHRAAIKFELEESKRAIEDALPGKTVRHICYPWHTAGKTAIEIAEEVGLEAGYWGRVDGRYYTSTGSNPARIARVGADFFFRLPGTGRISLMKILLKKVSRRAKTGSPYLAH